MAIPYEHRCTFFIAYQAQSAEREQQLDKDFERLFGVGCYCRICRGIVLALYGTTPDAVLAKLVQELPNFRFPCLVSAIPEGACIRAPNMSFDSRDFVERLLPKVQLVP